MSAIRWDPDQYELFSEQRGRPFHELVARVPADAPERVADLGCGPGDLTATLARRWPGAYVEGVDSSGDMIERARAYEQPSRLHFRLGDLARWEPERPIDVLLSNATLQWVPRHLEVLPRLVERVASGGWIAIQVPGNFAAPSHRLLRELAVSPAWVPKFAGAGEACTGEAGAGELARPAVEPSDYLEALAAAGCDRLDVWETTYSSVLPGEDPVFAWMKGTGARPYLQALEASDAAEPGDADRFAEEYRLRLREAYPRRPYGTVMPFRRVFAVARRG